jgi:REP element-mobilizing transposase RayT
MKSGSRLKPINEFQIYRRNLPHWENPGDAYFVTFNAATDFTLTDTAKEIVFSAIKFHAGKKYELHACVVMKTHVHILFLPLKQSQNYYYSLAQIMHSIKSYSANKIQRALGRKGSVWLDENYDRIVRDDHAYLEIMNYIIFNPVKAGIVNEPRKYKWLYFTGRDACSDVVCDNENKVT